MGAAAGTPKQLEPKIRQVSQRYGMALEPERLVHSLSIGERQRVEIIRCLMQDIRLLILDEPTSVLTPQEADELFVTLRRLASEGCSILFISHKLGEVRALCHSATVLRGGRVAGHCIPAECSDQELAGLMVGEAAGLITDYPKARAATPSCRSRSCPGPIRTRSAARSRTSTWKYAAGNRRHRRGRRQWPGRTAGPAQRRTAP